MTSVVSARTPPSRRNASMPERSVSTWKFMARRPLAMAKRTTLARSQPAMATRIATMRRGSTSPTCTKKTRAGSTRKSKFMALSFQQGEQPLQRDVDPCRAVVELVAQLVEHFLDLEERQQPPHI